MATRIKFCGMTRPEDARAAVLAGCNAIGMVLWPKSKRAVSMDRARAIAEAIESKVDIFGVFVSPTPEEVQQAAKTIGLTAAQLSGPLPNTGWEAVTGVRLVRVIGMNSAGSLGDGGLKFSRECILDSLDSDFQGGTGRTFDWSLVSGLSLDADYWLAGGLNPSNVARAIRTVRPYGVDVSSGIESSVGIKSVDLMREFVEEVRLADQAIGQDE